MLFIHPRCRFHFITGVLLAVALSAITAHTQVAAAPVKIYILAGQSNMLGHGEISPVTTQGTLGYITANDPQGKYQFLKTGANWAMRNDVLIRDQNGKTGGLTVGYGSASTTIGPELGFGHVVGDSLDSQVLLVKTSWGGKSLGFDFCPPSSRVGAPAPVADGDLGFYYKETLRLVNQATSNLAAYVPGYSGEGYEIAGFAWHQGWNDRIDAPMSAAYETNMANFINDIRADLGTPGLPFVIATTGMDGRQGHGYTQVENAQLKMADAIAYPAFAGNVAVIDARATYGDLDFWQPVSASPSPAGGQEYHWNRDAKTYLHLGLAMGEAMSLLAPGRNPYRPSASGDSSGAALTWENGTEIPTSVRVLRNGVQIAAAAPANPPTFLDASAPLGENAYELQFTMPGAAVAPLVFTHNTGIINFHRSDAANEDPKTAIAVEYGSNLTGWTTATHDGDNVIIQVTPGSPNDAITVKLKRTTLGATCKIFARLKVVVIP